MLGAEEAGPNAVKPTVPASPTPPLRTALIDPGGMAVFTVPVLGALTPKGTDACPTVSKIELVDVEPWLLPSVSSKVPVSLRVAT